MSIETVLARLVVKKRGETTMAVCPAHDDKQASLAVRVAEDGKVLLHCHANCPTENVVQAAGLEMADLFGDVPTQPVPQFGGVARMRPRLVATYEYRDRDGVLLYEACRYEPKTFRQRRPDGSGGYLWNLDGVTRVLYRLPELRKSRKIVLIVEGEKDVDALRKLGCVATCNVGGAGKWKPEYNADLMGRDVVILPDNDPAGVEHADKVARVLVGVAKSVKIVALPNLPPKGDVSDWIAAGGTKARLVEICQAAPIFDPSGEAVTPPLATAPSTVEVAAATALYDPQLEELLPGWMLVASRVERAQWFGRVILDLAADQDVRMLVEAILETHGTTASVDPAAILSTLRAKCATTEGASRFTMSRLDALAARAKETQVQPATLLRALDELRLQRSFKRVQGIQLAGDGRASVERMRAALAEEIALSPVEPALDFGDVLMRRVRAYDGFDGAKAKIVTVGLETFDVTMGGFMPGLVYIAGRPGKGKTALGMKMARGIVETMRRPVLFVSMEMKADPIADRIIADLASVENRRVRRADFWNDDERTRVADAARVALETYSGKLFIVEDSISPFDQILAGMHRHMQAHPDTAAIFVDYLQLAHGVKAENREQEISTVSRMLKKFADQYDVVVFVMSQLNRASETDEKRKKNEPEGRPRLRHLRGSGAIEQDADDVILLHTYEVQKDDEPRAEVVTLYGYQDKVRSGPTLIHALTFERPYQRILERATRAA